MEQLINRLLEKIPLHFMRREELLAKHTSFRIGGPAELMVFPHDAEQIKWILRCCAEAGIRPRILGAGTNILAPDAGVRGVVICLREALMGLTLAAPNRVRAMAGMTLAQTAMFAARNRLSGLEFAHGIPGTVGGGVYMNAGAYNGELCQRITETRWIDMEGNENTFRGEEHAFGYRSSIFQQREGIILETEFLLEPGDEAEIRARIQELAERRRASQPLEYPSAGSTFKRPVGGYAAALIEAAGLKGFAVGGAKVSEKHAGFVINAGGASAKEVLALIEEIRYRVQAHSGILLEPEVRLWGCEDEG